MDLEKAKRARVYIEKLANGINPIDGKSVDKNDVINNVQITRCLFYVNDLLREVIENGGITPKRTKKLPFRITAEELREFNYSNEPITISGITERINALVDLEAYKKFSYKKVTDWLVEIGCLQVIENNGKKVKRPTEQGNNIGISEEPRIGQNGPYIAVTYNREAQQFILDNFDAFLND